MNSLYDVCNAYFVARCVWSVYMCSCMYSLFGVCSLCVVHEYVVAPVCSVCGECMCGMHLWMVMSRVTVAKQSRELLVPKDHFQDTNATRLSSSTLERLTGLVLNGPIAPSCGQSM